jgi:SAM-dependent methyltransferase
VNRAIGLVGSAHGQVVHGRRMRRIVHALALLIEPGWSVCDLGCGDGSIGHCLAQSVPDLSVSGFELHPREETHIPVQAFDGLRLPVEDDAFDAVILVDVLHHTDDPMILLTEARRVARRAIVLKDHRTSRPLADSTLRFMDWVGNRSHGVPLPYNYWPEERWSTAWKDLGLRVDTYRTRLDLYPWPARWLFESGLQFVARLVPETADKGGD